MKLKKTLYGLSIFVGVLVVAVVVITLTVPTEPTQEGSQANANCVPSSLAGVPLVNGLGKDVKVPLFPGATRYSFDETGVSQYVAKAYDSEIFGFYQDRMRALCWEVKDQRNNQIVYKNNGYEVKIALQPNPAGKTLIDYMVLASEGVLGQVRIAQTSCTSDQFWCNGACVPMGTSCPSPTSSADCKGGTIYCPSSSGGSGWCQMSGSCPSTTTSGAYEDTQAKCTDGVDNDSDGFIDSSDPSCSAFTSSGTPQCSDGRDNDSDGQIDYPADTSCYGRDDNDEYYPTSTTGSTSQYEDTQAKCSDGVDNDGDNFVDLADPSCAAFTTATPQCSDGRDNDGDGQTDYPADTSCYGRDDTDEYYPSSTSTGGGGGCRTATTQSSCTAISGCVWYNNHWDGTHCDDAAHGGGTSGSSTSTYAGDANSCPGFSYSRWDSSGRRYCQLNNEVRCDYNYPSYLTNGSNYTAANCPTGSATGTSSCPSGQYMCNGSCISNNSSCSQTTWPTDQASCTSQGKFWCTSSTSGTGTASSGWCQSTACSTNYTTTSCPSGQWMCNNACISTSSQCNGYYYGGTTTTGTQSAGQREQVWNSLGLKSSVRTDADQARIEQLKRACANVPATANVWMPNAGTMSSPDFGMPSEEKCRSASVPPSGTTCASGYTWCSYSNECVATGRPCFATTPEQQQRQTQQQQQTQTTCNQGNYFCPSSNSCVPNGSPCGSGTTTGYQPYQPGGPGDQWGGPSEEDMKRMKEEQFKQMKRGIKQFTNGMTQMKRFVDRAKARLAKQGVGVPTELTNALAKAPELVAKLNAAQTIEEFEDLMGDMQDIGMIMQEWGPKMGELERLAGMLGQLDRDVRNMGTSFRRVRTAAARRPELAEALKELEAMLGVMGKKAMDAKALAKTDPEGALDLVQDFYDSSEEYWNQVAFVDMVGNVTRGLSQATSEIRRAESRIRTLERSKTVDAETVATLKDMLNEIKATLPELRAVLAKRPLDYEAVKDMAQSFWEQIQEFENLMSEQGHSFYAPTVKGGQGINIEIPQGFIASPSAGPGGGGPGGFEGPGGPGGGPGGFGPGGPGF